MFIGVFRMPRHFRFAVVALVVPLLAGCTTTYTMATRTGEVIETQGKPEENASTGLTEYADTFGYHRVIRTSEITHTTEGKTSISW